MTITNTTTFESLIDKRVFNGEGAAVLHQGGALNVLSSRKARVAVEHSKEGDWNLGIVICSLDVILQLC